MRTIKVCPKCGSGFHWQEYTCKPGATVEAECVQLEAAKRRSPNNGCTFTCQAVRMNNGDISFRYDNQEYEDDITDVFSIENYLYKNND